MSKPKTDARRPCIYVAQSATTRKFYVGQTRYGLSRRKNQHKDRAFNKLHNTKFCRALRELGWDDFQWEVVFIVQEELDKETLQGLLNEKEKFYVKYYNSFAEGYNSDSGGAGGVRYKYSTLEEKKKALRIGQKQRRAKNREAFLKAVKKRRDRREEDCPELKIHRYNLHRQYMQKNRNLRRAKNRKAINERQRKKRYENIEAYRAAFNERRRKRKESSSNS